MSYYKNSHNNHYHSQQQQQQQQTKKDVTSSPRQQQYYLKNSPASQKKPTSSAMTTTTITNNTKPLKSSSFYEEFKNILLKTTSYGEHIEAKEKLTNSIITNIPSSGNAEERRRSVRLVKAFHDWTSSECSELTTANPSGRTSSYRVTTTTGSGGNALTTSQKELCSGTTSWCMFVGRDILKQQQQHSSSSPPSLSLLREHQEGSLAGLAYRLIPNSSFCYVLLYETEHPKKQRFNQKFDSFCVLRVKFEDLSAYLPELVFMITQQSNRDHLRMFLSTRGLPQRETCIEVSLANRSLTILYGEGYQCRHTPE